MKFKLGIMAGLAVGWLVGTGKASEMLDDLRRRARSSSTSSSSTSDMWSRSHDTAPTESSVGRPVAVP